MKRITANLPESLLKDAVATTGKGITETLIEGLQMIKRTRAAQLAQELKKQIDFEVDIDETRGRNRR